MPWTGVLISWLIFDRNVDFSLLMFSGLFLCRDQLSFKTLVLRHIPHYRLNYAWTFPGDYNYFYVYRYRAPVRFDKLAVKACVVLLPKYIHIFNNLMACIRRVQFPEMLADELIVIISQHSGCIVVDLQDVSLKVDEVDAIDEVLHD